MSVIGQFIPYQKMPRDKGFFDYLIPEDLAKKLNLGDIVKIPFGRRQILSMYNGVVSQSPFDQLKEIARLESIDCLPKYQVDFLNWFSSYYHHSPASTLKLLYQERPKKKQNKELAKIDTPYVKIERSKAIENLVKKIYSSSDKKYILSPFEIEKKFQFYLSICDNAVATNKQVLILFPQADKVEYFSSLLDANLRKKAFVISSEVFRKKNQYQLLLDEIKNKNKNIILGTRSSVFIPLDQCELMIIDEVESSDYKQWDQNPRYNAVECLQKVQELQKNKLILASQSFPIEQSYLAKNQKYKYIPLGKSRQNKVSIIDLDHERQAKFTYYSERLLQEVDQAVQSKQRVLLIVNKLGSYSSIKCFDCDWVANCPKCKKSLTVDSRNKLICRHCSIEQDLPLTCPSCGGANLKSLGIGIDQVKLKLEKELGYKCSNDIDAKHADIILSTGQNIVPPKIKFDYVGFVYVDSLIYLADYNTNFVLYSYVKNILDNCLNHSGRASLQTFFHDNQAIESINLSYEAFYKNELEARKSYQYPPFSTIIKLIYQHHDEKVAKKEVDSIYQKLLAKNNQEARITEPYLYYQKTVRERYRYQIAVILPKISIDLEKQILSEVPAYWIIDKNPKDLL